VEGTIQRAVDAAAQKFNPIPESFHIALQIAAQQGHVPIVKLLLEVHGIDPNFRGELQATPLALATQEGHSVIVELLLAVVNINPDVRAGDREHGYTPLISACQMGHVSIVQQLLARNDVDVNACPCGSLFNGAMRYTPLIMACEKGHIEIINLLLAKDSIDINLVHRTTPLIAAAGRGLVEVVESFLTRDNNLNLNITDEDGDYALGCAASNGHIYVMKLLLDHPDVNPNVEGFARSTPLILGVHFPDVVKLLLDQEGIDVNYQDDFGSTALIRTACCGNVESAKLLLERGDIDVNIGGRRTALYHAYSQRSFRVHIMDLLLERDDIDINSNRYTPSAIADFEKKKGFFKKNGLLLVRLVSLRGAYMQCNLIHSSSSKYMRDCLPFIDES
jgi:ankyrin repeat protein